MHLLIFEKSLRTKPVFDNIDDCFKKIKQDFNNKKYQDELVKYIQRITRINKINFRILPNQYSAFSLPIYDNIVSASLNPKNNKLLRRTVQNKNKLEESGKFIKELTLEFGTILLNKLTPQQCTAVLLHELGHVLKHVSAMEHVWVRLIKAISFIGLMSIFISPKLFLASLLLFRSTSIFEHLREYNSDAFAAKYGYGEEMLQVLEILKKDEIKISKTENFIKDVKELLIGSTHPKDEKRQCYVIKQMMNRYKKMYPNFQKEIDRNYKNLNC